MNLAKMLNGLVFPKYLTVVPEKGAADGGGGEASAADNADMYVKIPKEVGSDMADEGKVSKGKADKSGKGAADEGSDDQGEEGEDADFTDKDDSGTEGEETEGEENDESSEGEEGAEEGEEKGAKKAPVLRIDPEDLARLTGANRQPREQAQPEKLTDAQIRELTNPVEVTDELVAAMGHEDPKVRQKALQQFANAAVKNAFSLTKIMAARMEKQFNQVLAPILSHYQESQQNNVRSSFFTNYKDLARYDVVVKACAAEVEPTRADGSEKSQKEIFREVAILTRKKLQNMGVKLNSSQANHSAEGEERKSGVPSPARFSSPGRSGGDQHSGKGKPNNADAEIYAGR